MVTPLQRRIEMSITSGLGYNSSTDFSKNYSIYSDGLEAEEVKNTIDGLNAHLREITRPERKYGKNVGFIFSSTGNRIHITNLSRFRFMQMKWKNQNFIDKAYKSRAYELGPTKVFFKGLVKKMIGDNSSILFKYLEYTNSS
ncbi:MAG: hypothetical protein U9Q73_02700 [Nanoarchaeota archaeon]|nr:hypothetical protein [Nanoarchaeota archaeon]